MSNVSVNGLTSMFLLQILSALHWIILNEAWGANLDSPLPEGSKSLNSWKGLKGWNNKVRHT